MVMTLLTIIVEVSLKLKNIIADKWNNLKIKNQKHQQIRSSEEHFRFKLKMKSHKNVEKVENLVKSSFDSSFVDKKQRNRRKTLVFEVHNERVKPILMMFNNFQRNLNSLKLNLCIPNDFHSWNFYFTMTIHIWYRKYQCIFLKWLYRRLRELKDKNNDKHKLIKERK